MPVFLNPTIVEKQGKVYRGKKRSEGEEERRAISELQSILNTKNRKVCDCEAQIHDLLENCLTCGRLTCVSEGPGKCFHCASIILSQDQRDRLQKFIDLTQSALPAKSKTQSERKGCIKIIDDQLDEASIQNKRHLRDSDKKKLKEELNELQGKRYQRKMVLDVDLETMQAHAVSAPLIDNYSSEMRKLQISDSTISGNRSIGNRKTLFEVMESQATARKTTGDRKTSGGETRVKQKQAKNKSVIVEK